MSEAGYRLNAREPGVFFKNGRESLDEIKVLLVLEEAEYGVLFLDNQYTNLDRCSGEILLPFDELRIYRVELATFFRMCQHLMSLLDTFEEGIIVGVDTGELK